MEIEQGSTVKYTPFWLHLTQPNYSPMGLPQLIIFDCDGVLVDSELIANQVLCDGLIELGLDYTLAKTIEQFMGRSFEHIVQKVESMGDRQIPESFWLKMQQTTFARFERELTPITGVEDILKDLSIPYCVASSGNHEKINTTLGLTGLLTYFEGRIYSAEDVSRGKPAPDLFLFAAAANKVKPSSCLVIEDSLAGVRAAKSAQMNVFGFCGMKQKLDLNTEQIPTFQTMAQLPELIATL